MSNWDASDEDGDDNKDDASSGTLTFCVQSEKEASDAQEVCDALRIPIHRASFAAEYWDGVFEPFVEGIDRGRMPNPDGKFVVCNEFSGNILSAFLVFDIVLTLSYSMLLNASVGCNSSSCLLSSSVP